MEQHHLLLSSALENLIGEECWKCIAGPGTGSMVSLHFGKKVPRSNSAGGQRHEVEDFKGEYVLFVGFAPWDLEADAKVICDSNDPNHVEGPMVRGLKRLVGATVCAFDLSSPSRDLTISFHNELVLHLVCRQFGASNEDNYSLLTQQCNYTVDHQSAIRIPQKA